MRRLSRLLSFSWKERRVLFYACLLLNGIRLGLWLFPFGFVRRSLTNFSSKWICSEPDRSVSIYFIRWAVTFASRHTPGGAMCLVKALTTQVLLNRYGYPHHLHIGVAKSIVCGIEAHAWIEYKGQVLMGASHDLSRFKPLSVAGAKK